MFNYSAILQNAFTGFNLIFIDYFKFWLVFGLFLMIFFGLFDLFFRQ